MDSESNHRTPKRVRINRRRALLLCVASSVSLVSTAVEADAANKVKRPKNPKFSVTRQLRKPQNTGSPGVYDYSVSWRWPTKRSGTPRYFDLTITHVTARGWRYTQTQRLPGNARSYDRFWSLVPLRPTSDRIEFELIGYYQRGRYSYPTRTYNLR